MPTPKPSDQIVARFQISRESAKFFLGRVQKSFKTEKPPHQLIVEFMDGFEFDSLPKPWTVAKGMFDEGIWAHPLHAEPVEPGEEGDAYFTDLAEDEL